MARLKELETCLIYAKKLYELQSKKKEHQKNIIDFEYTLEGCIQKNKICNYVILGIIGIAMIFLICDFDEKVAMMVTLSMVLIIAIVVKIFFKRELKEYQEMKIAYIERQADVINEINEQFPKLIEEMFDKNMFDIIPPSYFYPSAIEFIISVFDRRLADDMKEAFHLLEAEIQRTRAIRRQSEFNESLIGEVQKLADAVTLNTYLTSKKE